MPIRIMHVVDTLAMGGMQNGIANLIAGLDPTRFEHVCCAMRPVHEANMQSFPAGRMRAICLSPKETSSRIQIAALARRIREVKPDIVHSRNWGAIEAVMAARLVGSCASIQSEHGIDVEPAAREPKHRSCLRRLAYETADRVMAVSYHLRDLHAGRTGFPARKITVIHNGVDHHRFFPDAMDRISIRSELGIADSEFCIGCVGNLIPVKDHLTLLKAADVLDHNYRNWRLLLVGDGPELPKLQAFVNDHPGWKKKVHFAGRSRRVPELLRAMDVFVLPSVSEGICNSLLEAMGAALPVAVTATGGNPEVVANGKSGLLFPVGDWRQLASLLLLLQAEAGLCAELGKAAMRRVRENFSIDSMVRRYEEMYESLRPAVYAPLTAASGG